MTLILPTTATRTVTLERTFPSSQSRQQPRFHLLEYCSVSGDGAAETPNWMRKTFDMVCRRVSGFIDPWFPPSISGGFVAIILGGIYTFVRVVAGHFIEYLSQFAYFDIVLASMGLIMIAMYLRGH